MIQSIINILYRNPKSKLNHYKKFGGYFNLKKIEKARQEMEKAAFSLTPVQSHDNGLPIYFLTGKKYLYQTLFCSQSLVLTTSESFKFYLIDDGSFDQGDLDNINRLLPGSIVYTRELIAEQLEKHLPIKYYPYLHHKRAVYPHIKKLTDVHIFKDNDWKLVLDSDMLFWNTPNEIIDWLKKPTKPIHMLDCAEAYGYSYNLMKALTTTEIKPLINVGTIGLCSSNINWDKIEYWCKELEKQEGTSYYLEQALTAMIIGNTESLVLNETNYIVNPTKIDKKHILHHYVDTSKELYFKEAWKKVSN